MSVNSISPSSMMAVQPGGASPSLKNALSSTLDVASGLTLMMNSLLQNVLKSAQQQPGLGNPGLGNPGLGAPGIRPPGVGGPPQLGGLGGLLQSMTQLLSAVMPLMQALSGGLGANPNAMQFANQMPGAGMGIGPQLRPQMPMAYPTPMGMPQQFPTQMGMPGNGLMGVGPSLTNAFGAAGGALGGLAGGALGGPVGATLGSTLGGAAGTVAGTVLASELGMPTTGRPGANGFSVNTPVQIGGMSPQSALSWAITNGGPNVQASDIMQGMQLYSIFNTGNRMF